MLVYRCDDIKCSFMEKKKDDDVLKGCINHVVFMSDEEEQWDKWDKKGKSC